MTLACCIYGLGLRINVPIAGLKGLAAPSRIDVSLVLGDTPPEAAESHSRPSQDFYTSGFRDEHGEPEVRVARLADGAYIRIAYADGTRVVVDAQASRIWAKGPATASVEDTAAYLLGPALGYVLRLRGVTCLHASAVAIGGKAVAFVGPAGAGKSSTAAAFAKLGYPVLTDDVAPLEENGTGYAVQPAYPRIRLWPDAVESLFGAPDALPVITPGWEKRYLALDGRPYAFQREALPLAAIYVLGDCIADDDSPRLEALSARSALISLVRETYSTLLLDRTLREKEFELLGRLVERVPVRRLTARPSLRRMSVLCDAVVRDVVGLKGASA